MVKQPSISGLQKNIQQIGQYSLEHALKMGKKGTSNIVYLGGDPNSLNERPSSDEFNAQFNKSRAKIEQEELSDMESA